MRIEPSPVPVRRLHGGRWRGRACPKPYVDVVGKVGGGIIHVRTWKMSSGVEHGREPCPDRILDDVGGAFGMGAVGGGLWHTVKGIKNSPQGQRLLGGSEVRETRAAYGGGGKMTWTCTCVRRKRCFTCDGVAGRGTEGKDNERVERRTHVVFHTRRSNWMPMERTRS